FINFCVFGSFDFDSRKMTKTLLPGSKIMLLLSSDENANLAPSILSSAFSKYEQLGSSAVKFVLPDSDLHFSVAIGSPGLNEIKTPVIINIMKKSRIEEIK